MLKQLGIFFFVLLSFQVLFAQEDAYRLGVEGVKAVDAGNYDEGIKLLKKARNIAPEDYDYTFEIGKAYYKSGNPKMAEKFLYPLQYHVNVQPDLYVLLAKCYYDLNEKKKNPDQSRKKELDALRYGIQKFPNSGLLYTELGRRKLEEDEPDKALAVFETGIAKDPNHAENYFWAAKILSVSRNYLWTWIYAELFLNLSDNVEMNRTAALLIQESTAKVFSEKWNAEPEKMDQELRFLLKNTCKSEADFWTDQLAKRRCLIEHWPDAEFPIVPLTKRMQQLEEKGWLEAYLATIYLESDKEVMLQWLSTNAAEFETYRKWRYWNAMQIEEPIIRLN